MLTNKEMKFVIKLLELRIAPPEGWSRSDINHIDNFIEIYKCKAVIGDPIMINNQGRGEGPKC